MLKIKVLTVTMLYGLMAVWLARPALANGLATVAQIQTLPGYINYTDFKLSCTTDGTGTAYFYSRRDDQGYTQFATVNLSTNPCQIQVTGAQFGSEGKFWFKVAVDSKSTETSTILDTSGPDNVSQFSKSRTGGGTVYYITWKNPNNSDYQRVFIYRGTEPGFEADGNKIAEAGGSPSDTMSYDDGSLDPTKEYYYYIRALDHANNASGLIGDSSTTTVYTTPTPGTGTGGRVTVLPKEQGTGGSVLGTESNSTTSPEPTFEPTSPGVQESVSPVKWVMTHKKISLGVLALLALLGYSFFKYSKRSN